MNLHNLFSSRLYKYDYIIFNNVPFSDNYKKEIQSKISSKVTFIVIPPELWEPPSFVNMSLVKILSVFIFSRWLIYRLILGAQRNGKNGQGESLLRW